MKCITIFGCLVASVTFSACGDSDSPGGPDFERELGPFEYQVSVTGDVQRNFETTGAVYGVGDRVVLWLWDHSVAFEDGAQFDICPTAQQGAYVFDAVTRLPDCASDASRAIGGFIVQLGGPQTSELDCYPNGAGDKDFEGVLTITSTDGDIRGEAQGNGTCSVHPHSEIEPMNQATVSIRIRFRAVFVDANTGHAFPCMTATAIAIAGPGLTLIDSTVVRGTYPFRDRTWTFRNEDGSIWLVFGSEREWFPEADLREGGCGWVTQH